MSRKSKDNAYKAPIEKYRKEIGDFNRRISYKMEKEEVDKQIHPEAYL
jgi:hypothetical protein